MLFVDAAHEGGGGREDFVDEYEDGLLGAELDALSDYIDEQADGQVCGDEILLLVDSSDVGFLNLLADNLEPRSQSDAMGKTQGGQKQAYRDAVGVLLANAFGFCLTFLERMLVLELGTHGDGM